MLSTLFKLIKTLNSEQSAGQIAAAISLAAIVGLTPLFSLHNLLVLLIVLFFRVNLSFFLVCWPLFEILGVLISPVSEQLGLTLLQMPALVPSWEAFYNTLVGRWSNFYYGNLLGSLAIAIVLALFLFPACKYLITHYRNQWLMKIEQYHLIKLLKASKFWHLYQGYANR